MKTTDPYSPNARANASEKPASKAGNISGKMIFTNIWKRDAPKLEAALLLLYQYFEVLVAPFERQTVTQ